MAVISKEDIEHVLGATDIVALIHSYVPLKRAGVLFRANCPFHSEKTPSFYVNPARQRFHCFGCSKSGDAIAFIREYENLPFTDAVKKLAQRSGIQIREEAFDPNQESQRRNKGRLLELLHQTSDFLHQQLLKSADASHARDYIKARGFGSKMVTDWGIGWMPAAPNLFLNWARERKFSGRELVDAGICYLQDEENPKSGLRVRFRDRLMFPIRDEIGNAIGFSGRQLRENPNSGKYINSPETPLFRKSRVLFALDRARKPILNEKAALLCEGQLDVIACHEAGVEHALAPLGTALTKDHAKLLKRYTKEIQICYDADAAGLAATTRAFRELAPESLTVRVITMPSGEDPDSFLAKHGAERFRELLAKADPFFQFKFNIARKQGELDDASGRSKLLAECAELLGLMADFADRENQINQVAGNLQVSAAMLRKEIARIQSRPAAKQRIEIADPEKAVASIEATPVHRSVGFMCHLALTSIEAQHLLAEQFETLHEAMPWIEGVALLEKILTSAPDPSSPAAINAFMSTLPEPDRLALTQVENNLALNPVENTSSSVEHALLAAEHALSMLSSTVLLRRDAAIKTALKQPGLDAARMIELMAEAKEVTSLLRGIGQRFEFDDELPASTYQPKRPTWIRRDDRGSHTRS
ncbi:MAG: DNA primase [Luteolibacter sp.]